MKVRIGVLRCLRRRDEREFEAGLDEPLVFRPEEVVAGLDGDKSAGSGR